jgi:epoxyqueuosine reductase
MSIGKQIIDAALENGATLAGIADMAALKSSPSHWIYPKMGDYAGVGTVKDGETLPPDQLFNWPDSVKSVLVIALAHPKDLPLLDWWDGKGTPGNRLLMDIIKRTRQQIETDLNIRTHALHYYVEKGGVFLKDAAALAGLGCIGENNMLVTPEYGPRVRLRALFLEAEIPPTGPVAFDPCADCNVKCRRVCPENAMGGKAPEVASIDDAVDLPARDGSYSRNLCNNRMEKDVAEALAVTKYCRKCEFVCPVGKKGAKDSP